MMLELGVVVDLEVISRVDVPVETVVMNIVLVVIGVEACLRASAAGGPQYGQHREEGHEEQALGAGSRGATRGDAHAHKQYLELGNVEPWRSYCVVERACKPCAERFSP